jgi:hypothetical protein
MTRTVTAARKDCLFYLATELPSPWGPSGAVSRAGGPADIDDLVALEDLGDLEEVPGRVDVLATAHPRPDRYADGDVYDEGPDGRGTDEDAGRIYVEEGGFVDPRVDR